MHIIGTLIEKSEKYQVKSKKNGTAFDCVDIVLEYEHKDHTNKVAFKVFGNYARDVEKLSLPVKLKVSFHPMSNFSNGRWYTNLRVDGLYVHKVQPKVLTQQKSDQLSIEDGQDNK